LEYIDSVQIDSITLILNKIRLKVRKVNREARARIDDQLETPRIVFDVSLTDKKWKPDYWPDGFDWPPRSSWEFTDSDIYGTEKQILESRLLLTRSDALHRVDKQLRLRDEVLSHERWKALLSHYYGREAIDDMNGVSAESDKRIVELKRLMRYVNLKCKFISTHRLRRGAESGREQLSVVLHSRHMADRIRLTYHQFSRVGDARSQTFPRRVLSAAGVDYSTLPMYSELSRLEESRAELIRLGILPGQIDESRPNESVKKPKKDKARTETFQEVFLRTYIDDEKAKIEEYEKLRRKTATFLDFINNHLHRKKISISFDGSRAGTKTEQTDLGAFLVFDDYGRQIPLDRLSSGEQHLITWSYELIFESEGYDFVLIDEPELSMHVEWQIDFVDAIEKISSEDDFRFIIATHSPAIVNSRWEITARLEDETDQTEKTTD
ncbi:MAG: hypothetical protein DRP09_18515, partial [Candidatus Thorarchaeota archaeon]